MATVTLAWSADADSAVVSYSATFTQNGAALPPIAVPAVPGQLTYSVSFPQTLAPGDVVGATVSDADGFGQTSPVIASTPATVTVPLPAAPAGPTNVTLTLTP